MAYRFLHTLLGSTYALKLLEFQHLSGRKTDGLGDLGQVSVGTAGILKARHSIFYACSINMITHLTDNSTLTPRQRRWGLIEPVLQNPEKMKAADSSKVTREASRW